MKVVKTISEDKNFKVAIFGSSRIKEGDLRYRQIRNLAEKLGERGIDIITGGGPGLMKAASEGHKLGRSSNYTRTIGLSIDLPKEQKTNKYVDVEKKFSRFSTRLEHFMLLSNAIVVAPGGVGTLLEFFYSWQLVQTKKVKTIPIILLGQQWHGMLNWLREFPLRNKMVDKEDIHLIQLVKNVDEAIKLIDKNRKSIKKRRKKK